ncbi:MAG: hypothetical protein IT429_14900 [Gemmataceae bacterium]|nr:hypothetical protein [Gemmataceae bacterium]
MIGIKAIETSYKGYRFRSRLEARWAVFFDALGISWEYEKQGYNLPSGPYLPDFWLPYTGAEYGWGFWVEIKPIPLTTHETQLLAELVEATGHRAYAISGNPWTGEHQVSVFQHHHGGKPEQVPLHAGGSFNEKVIVPGCAGTKIYLVGSGWVYSFPDDYESAVIAAKPRLQHAFILARSARFEHGDSPATATSTPVRIPPPRRYRITTARPAVESDFVVGGSLNHPTYGTGQVTDIRGNGVMKRMDVRFPSYGTKTFAVERVVASGLLFVVTHT